MSQIVFNLIANIQQLFQLLAILGEKIDFVII